MMPTSSIHAEERADKAEGKEYDRHNGEGIDGRVMPIFGRLNLVLALKVVSGALGSVQSFVQSLQNFLVQEPLLRDR